MEDGSPMVGALTGVSIVRQTLGRTAHRHQLELRRGGMIGRELRRVDQVWDWLVSGRLRYWSVPSIFSL